MSEIKVNSIKGAAASTAAITVHNTDGTATGKFTNIPGRNILLNGACVVAQRGDVAGVEYGYGGCDRWRFSGGSAARVTMNRTTGPTTEGFGYCQELDVTTADASLAAGDYNMLSQKMEGFNLQHIKKGTSGAESLTLSFWVSSPKTGTHIVELYDQTNSRQISKAYTVSAANTWEKKTVTFAGDTSGTIANSNANGLTLEFWLCAGSTYSSGTLNTSWAAITNANRAVGQVNCMDNTSNDFKLTGVQLETGTVATDFQYKLFNDDIRECQRYYCKTYAHATAPGTDTWEDIHGRQSDAGSNSYAGPGVWYYPGGEMRAKPTCVLYSKDGDTGKINIDNAEGPGTVPAGNLGVKGMIAYRDNDSTGSTGAGSNISFHATADAEL